MAEQGNITGMEGHVYVVEFESRMIKVGYSAKPENRFRGYIKNGVLYGNPVTRTWVSPAHFAPQRNERLLIEFCTANGTLASGGRRGEYFNGVSFKQAQRFAASLDFVPFDRERWERDNADRLAALRDLWGSNSRSRLVHLPPSAGVPHGTLGEWFEAARQEDPSSDLPELVAELFDVDLDDLLAISPGVDQQVLAHVAEVVTCKRDIQHLEQALGAAKALLAELETTRLDDLRREVSEAVDELWLSESELRRVTLPNGTEAMIMVKPEVSQQEADQLAAEYWRPEGSTT